MNTDAVKVDIGRGSVVTLLVSVPLSSAFSGLAVYAALDAEDTATAVIGFFFAAVFAFPVLAIAMLWRRLVERRGLAFDAHGVHHWRGSTSTLVPWQEVAGVGIGYDQPPSLPPFSLSDYLNDKIIDGLKIDRRRAIAVEIFPVDNGAFQRYAALVPYRREQQPPLRGLSSTRWRVPLPPLPRLAASVGNGVETFQRRCWLGWFARS